MRTQLVVAKLAGALFLGLAITGQIKAREAVADHLANGGPVQTLPPWTPGILDIHHINTGRGNAAFFIFPDGTTMLFDAGALSNEWGKGYEPLALNPARPDTSRRPGEWIADYIAQFAPAGMKQLDYAVISHFHADHFGELSPFSPPSRYGPWKLTGLTDVAERWPIRMLVDRANPGYDFPVALRAKADASLRNYLAFVDGGRSARGMITEGLEVGRNDQIRLLHQAKRFPAFSVRNIAGGGSVWTGAGTASSRIITADQITAADGKFNENPLSITLKISYGPFDYLTGGDTTGVNDPDQPSWFNVESRIAPVIGKVDALSLNHHGNRDATNADWLRTLAPRVIVQQSWVSDQPGGEVVARLISRKLWSGNRDIFATHVQDATKIAIGPWLTKNYASTEGHVLIRVQPGGTAYEVYVLDDRTQVRAVKARFGPYPAK